MLFFEDFGVVILGVIFFWVVGVLFGIVIFGVLFVNFLD